MTQTIGCTTFLVHDYDDAIAFFTQVLRLDLLQDEAMGEGKRWVTVGPRGGTGARLLLARATTEAQRACVGRQAGDRVFLFLHSDDFAADHARMLRCGVVFDEAPRHEPYGTVAVFRDLYGNRWDLLQPAGADA